MNSVNAMLLAALLLAPPGLLFAHHGTAGTYDQKKVVKLSGVVKEFRWRNPHCTLVVTGKDDAGNEGTFAFEVGSPNSMIRRGLSRETFKVGESVSFDMHPSFNNPNVGQPIGGTVMVNGKALGGMAGADE